MADQGGKTRHFKRAVKLARRSRHKPSKQNHHPQVGAVLVRGSKTIEVAYHGEIARCDHAEYTLLERKLAGVPLHCKNAVLYTTLEPCTERTPPKVACVERVRDRGIKKVWIGMLDPNPTIFGKGAWQLRQNGVAVEYFPREFRERILEQNKDFINKQTQRFDEPAFREKRLPELFLDPVDPLVDVGYALFRMCAASRIVFFNTHLKMFTDPHEFESWWVNGALQNKSIKNTQMIIAATAENIAEAMSSENPLWPKMKHELPALGGNIYVTQIKEGSPVHGIFFTKRTDANREFVDYCILWLDIPAGEERRVMLVIDRSKGWEVVLDALWQKIQAYDEVGEVLQDPAGKAKTLAKYMSES